LLGAVVDLRLPREAYFFFFGAAFLAGAFFAAFFVAFFIDRFSLTSVFAIRNRSQCDSYIRLFAAKVKKKMRISAAQMSAEPIKRFSSKLF
jgi:hypothetical protein